MIKKRYYLLLMLILSFVSACSSTQIAYNNADWFMLDKLDDFFNLSNKQEEQLERDIHDFLLWHRSRELPEYYNLLSAVSDEYIDGISAAELSKIQLQLYAARNRLIERAIPPISNFLTTVTTTQIKHYDQVVRSRLNEKKKLLELTDEQYKNKFFSEFVDTMKRWFGNLTDLQQSDIRSITDRLPNNRVAEVMQSEKYHQQFLTLLSIQSTSIEIEKFLRTIFVTPINRKVAQQGIKDRSKAKWRVALLDIDKLITPGQRQRAIARVINYRDDFMLLSQQY